MEYKLTKVALLAATICFSSNAMAQDGLSAFETLYFDFDRAANQTGVDTQKIRTVLESCSVSSMSITGHTDSSGGKAYNRELSQRRANVIKAEVVSWGLINGTAITTRGAGENELAINSGDGVKEQLNRRAEIQFGFSQPCGLYYTAPVSDPVIYSEPVRFVEPTPVVTTPAPAPVAAAPTPAPVAAVPTPAPVPAAPAPVSVPAPIAAPSSSLPAIYGLAGFAAVAGAVLVIDSDNDDLPDGDDDPVSP